jgi:hypothetical protein
MGNSLYIGTTESGSGKALIALGTIELILRKAAKVSFLILQHFGGKCCQQTGTQVFPTEGNFAIHIWRNYSIDTIRIEGIKVYLAIDIAQKPLDRLSRTTLGNVMYVSTKAIIAIVEGVATTTREIVLFQDGDSIPLPSQTGCGRKPTQSRSQNYIVEAFHTSPSSQSHFPHSRQTS